MLAMLALSLAVRGALLDPLNPWTATAILVTASLVVATLAVRQRREVWALAAALCLNLAMSLPLVRFRLAAGLPFADWWMELVRANVFASAGAALVWLAAWQRMYGATERPAAPLLL